MDPAAPDSWFREGHSGMVQLYQSQAQWDNRACPRVHEAFADLWGTEKLWCSFGTQGRTRTSLTQRRARVQSFQSHDCARSVRRALPLQMMLCVSDMAHMKPPARPPHWDGDGFVHWDLDEEILRQPLHLRLQGELLLEDMPRDAGGFQCVPGFHLRTPDWVAQQPEVSVCHPHAVSVLRALRAVLGSSEPCVCMCVCARVCVSAFVRSGVGSGCAADG
jgi:hypothetical protein